MVIQSAYERNTFKESISHYGEKETSDRKRLLSKKKPFGFEASLLRLSLLSIVCRSIDGDWFNPCVTVLERGLTAAVGFFDVADCFSMHLSPANQAAGGIRMYGFAGIDAQLCAVLPSDTRQPVGGSVAIYTYYPCFASCLFWSNSSHTAIHQNQTMGKTAQ